MATKKIKKYNLGGPGTPTTFQTDSVNFRKNEKLYGEKPNLKTETELFNALQKHGPKKLTGKSNYTLNDMVIEQKKKGGSVKSKKVIKSKKK